MNSASPPPELTLDRIAPYVKARFQVRHSSGPVEVELVEADPLPRHRSGVAEKFSLLFRGPRSRPLGQGAWTFEHPEAGRFNLFVVPVVSRDPQGHDYEAVINREGRG